ncbi:hypothetical protein SLEP1_g55220 [Rubroshorea leprosula]|uniref:PROP1-like PPR domain-containing protein n=1 Tax=Rubroshorea leprosula TaxID=152421 RepID=A0AAV5MEQ7_9ROSI|nr:hypothetical protein SLEP1_g55220 [Rubroshorea leprosula]
MFLKFQPGNSSFHILCSTKTSPPSTGGVSVFPPEKFESINKHRQPTILEVANGGGPRLNGVKKQSLDKTSDVHGGGFRRSERIPDREQRKTRTDGGGIDNGRTNSGGRSGKCTVEKVHAKCSTKWVSYGGCIPAILEALDRRNDLEEALRPWEEGLSSKERSIILKEQSSWERALGIFEWFKRKGGYEMNVIHYNIMLRILGKAHKWGHIQSLWDEMNVEGIAPINSTYGTLIDVYHKGGLKYEALCWLGRMNKQGMEPDEVTMGIVVQLYKKAGQLKEASETFAMMLREGITPTTVTFNTMIHICGNHGLLEEVSLLMKKMEELRCPPDTRTYNILISLHVKRGDIQMATAYFTKMKQIRLEPDNISYRTLLYAYSIRHMIVETEGLIQEMDERGLEVDEYIHSALTRMYIEAGMVEKSWLWFWRFHLAGNMSSECYSANINAYGERGHVLEAEKVFICCQEEKKLTVHEFNVMIKAYGIGKNYDKACQLFDSMESHGVVPDKCSYNCLIQILASADLPHLAKRYLRKMQESGLVSDCVLYCALISSYVKLGQPETAEELYRVMIQCNVEPDVVVYGVLINAFADLGSVKEATRYLDAMRSAGLSGNTVIYNSLIKLYTKVGYLKEAVEIYKLLQSTEGHPNVYSSNCMIDLYSELSMVRQAEELFQNLKRKRVANEFTYAMMLCMYRRNGRFTEATQIAKQMRELGLLTDLLSYNNVIGLYATDGRFMEVVRTFKEMIDAAVQPDGCTFKSLRSVLVRCGVPKPAVHELEARRKKDPKSGLQAWMSTLSSVVGADEYYNYDA